MNDWDWTQIAFFAIPLLLWGIYSKLKEILESMADIQSKLEDAFPDRDHLIE